MQHLAGSLPLAQSHHAVQTVEFPVDRGISGPFLKTLIYIVLESFCCDGPDPHATKCWPQMGQVLFPSLPGLAAPDHVIILKTLDKVFKTSPPG